MNSFKVRYTVLMILFCIFISAGFWIDYSKTGSMEPVDIYAVPLEIGDWNGKELVIEDSVKKILETDSVMMREYSRGTDKIWLAVVHYNDARVSLHLPESCYSGEGSKIAERSNTEVSAEGRKDFTAKRMIVKGNKGNRIVFYYFLTGNTSTGSYRELRWIMMKNKMSGKSNRGALIRFSAPIKGSIKNTDKTVRDFIYETASVLEKYL
ncbi:exosortase C-terminal domain/associated protein EpsI [Elusimicrobiota bacterium]